MKKIIILFSMVLALLFSGCGKEKANANDPVSTPETAVYAAPTPTQTPDEGIYNFVITEDGKTVDVEKKLEGLATAELYVKQLDQSFVITESETLRELEAALSAQEEYPYYESARAGWNFIYDYMESANPLYLYFEDGRTGVVHTMGNGSPGATIWGGCGFDSSRSIFDMFGVPLDAAGYTYNADGTTTVTIHSAIRSPGLESEVITTETNTVYTPDGRILCQYSPYSSFFDGAFLREYQYDEVNKPIAMKLSVGDVHLESAIYEYNDFDKMSKYTAYDSGGNWTYRYEYDYDEQGRMIAAMDYYAIGAHGAGVYYWYDENGEQHSYTYEHDGSLYGEAPPDVPAGK